MRGLSPLIASLLLIGIAVTGSAFIFGISNQFATNTVAKTSLDIIEAEIIKTGTNSNPNCFVNIEIANTGNSNFISGKISFTNGTGFNHIVSITSDKLQNFNPGRVLNITNPDYEYESSSYTTSEGYCTAWKNDCKEYPITVILRSLDSITSDQSVLKCSTGEKI